MQQTINRLFNRALSSRANNYGYTIDQTILIVAIIAILITLIILTVAWQLINRAGGTKLGAQLKQVEDANGQFYADQRLWPHQAFSTGNSSITAMLALVNQPGSLTWAGAINQVKLKNLLPGFAVDATPAVTHNLGGTSGQVRMTGWLTPVGAGIGTDRRMLIMFYSVPLADAKEADLTIDGKEDNKTGRVVYGSGYNCFNANPPALPTDTPTSGNVNVCYYGNAI